jgi:hypothetical protein
MDRFFSVIVYKKTGEMCLYRFPLNPLHFADPNWQPLSLADGELVLDDYNPLDFDLLEWFLGEYSWSPDGDQIAYVNATPNPFPEPPLYSQLGAYTLRIKTLATSDTPASNFDVPLSPNKIDKLANLSWSPDGERICFYAWLDLGGQSLNTGDWTVRVDDGSGLTQLYSGYSGYNGGKKWSLLNNPSWVTYEDTNNTGIFLIKPDKSEGPYNLTADLPTSKKSPEKRELIDWVSTTNVVVSP